MKNIIQILLIVAVLLSCESELNERKILRDIEKRLEIDMKEYDVDFVEVGDGNNGFRKDMISVFLTHKTHLPMVKEDERRYGDEYIPTTGDICGNCWRVIYDTDSSKILDVMGVQ